MYSPGNGLSTAIQDSGPAGGGLAGLGLSEILQVNPSPLPGTGTGPLGTHDCAYSAPIANGSGYYYFCLDAFSQGGGLMVYGAGGGAPQEPLNFNINGTNYTFPFSVGGIVGPSTSVIGHSVCWNNTVGSLVLDCGPPLLGPSTTVVNDTACWNNTTGTLLKDCGTTGLFLPLTGGTLTPTAGTYNPGFIVNQTGPASAPVTGPQNYNAINATHTTAIGGPAGTTQAAALRVNMETGGVNLAGGPIIGTYSVITDGISGTVNGLDKIGEVGSCDVSIFDVNSGCYGGNSVAVLESTGTIGRLVGYESDILGKAGGTASYRYAYSAVNAGAIQATTGVDAAYVAGNIGGTGGSFENLMLLTNSLGFAPISTTGNLFVSDTAFTVANVFDMGNATVTDKILNFPNVTLTGSGNLTVVNATLTGVATQNGLFACISTGNIIGSESATCVPSSKRYKDDHGLIPMKEALDFIANINPSIFTGKAGQTKVGPGEHEGIYAEDVCRLSARACVLNDQGQPESYDDRAVLALLLRSQQATLFDRIRWELGLL